jgi:hypothetical protein
VLVAMNIGDAPAVIEADSVLLSSGAGLEPAPGGYVLPPDTAAWLR